MEIKKQFVIIGILTLFVTAELSGCQESQTSGDTDKVQLQDYTIETYYNYGSLNIEKLGDGFIHNNSYTNRSYLILGTVKDIAGEMLNNLVITLNFYNSNSNFLASKTYTIPYLSGTETFHVVYYDSEPYFDNIDNVKFKFTVS
jgi:hypothetical protein